MNKRLILAKTRKYVKGKMMGEGTGHDWFHVERVVKMANRIAKKEGGDLFVIQMAALLHDINDWKFQSNQSNVEYKRLKKWLLEIGLRPNTLEIITHIINNISFKGGTSNVQMSLIEGKIVQDADRLDALGAIGIARTFAFGGRTNREIYNPSIKPKKYRSFQNFKASIKTNTTINHFYEKLLQLKGLMNTDTSRKIAQKRHRYLVAYLKKFFAEWRGQD